MGSDMRGLAGVLFRLSIVGASCFLMPLLWGWHLYATTAVTVCIGGVAGSSLVMLYVQLARRSLRVERVVIAPEDRERLRNRALLDHAPVPLLFQGADGAIHVANRAARQMFGTEDRLIDPPPAVMDVLTTRSAGPARRLVRIKAHGAGSARVFAVSVGEGGGVSGGIRAYLALTDVEAGLNAAEAQALRDLLQVLSHELMNSLTPIVSLSATAAELFADMPRDDAHDAISGALATIHRRAEGLDRFVRSYRDMARLPEPVLKTVDLADMLQDVGRLFLARWGIRVAFECVVPSVRVMARLDKVQMEQALSNVLNNAAEAALSGPCPEAPRVRLGTVVSGGGVVILVSDNGGGVPESAREQIFQPFMSFRPDGNGVGLSLARQIALAHGGSLTLDETDTGGWRTTFRLEL